ncbi:transporter, major facilitator family protein [Entamoeba histolytica HM-3:IMSS]|nr:transporter, major facilitator family protein [Entamoeba histolytica HM-3:IMSS]
MCLVKNHHKEYVSGKRAPYSKETDIELNEDQNSLPPQLLSPYEQSKTQEEEEEYSVSSNGYTIQDNPIEL